MTVNWEPGQGKDGQIPELITAKMRANCTYASLQQAIIYLTWHGCNWSPSVSSIGCNQRYCLGGGYQSSAILKSKYILALGFMVISLFAMRYGNKQFSFCRGFSKHNLLFPAAFHQYYMDIFYDTLLYSFLMLLNMVSREWWPIFNLFVDIIDQRRATGREVWIYFRVVFVWVVKLQYEVTVMVRNRTHCIQSMHTWIPSPVARLPSLYDTNRNVTTSHSYENDSIHWAVSDTMFTIIIIRLIRF